MLLYFYATFVAALLFDFVTLTPIPQITPMYACPPGYILVSLTCVQNSCPSTHYFQNGACYLKTTTVQTVVAQPCPTTTTSCSTGTAAMPIVTQPCPAVTTLCPTSVVQNPVVTPSCPTTTTSCSTEIVSTSIVTTPCLVATTECPPVVTPKPKEKDPVPCPKGTIRINGYCHLIYCGSGIYRDGKCIQTVCPDGTVWTGSQCKVPEAHNHTTLHISNVVTTNINQTDINRGINYTNNIVIHITESPLILIPSSPSSPPPPTPPTPPPTPTPPSSCCIVITPVACMWEINQYNCRSRKYRRCGSICIHGYIYLKPPVVVPPPRPCFENDCDITHHPFYPDCSRCDNVVDDMCTTYCRRTVCQTRRCQSIDLKEYCGSYPRSIGCRRIDGCHQDWCDDY